MTSNDYGRGGGNFYQNLLSLYINTLFKGKYKLSSLPNAKEDYKEFRSNIKRFKQDILHKNFSEEKRLYDFDSVNNTKDKNIDILLEGDGECFEDINILKVLHGHKNDLHVFIQAKTKRESGTNIGPGDGILKSFKNFRKNLNFQKFKDEKQFMFFIFLNKNITKSVLPIINKNLDGYYLIADYILTDNYNKKIKDDTLPNFKFKKLTPEKNYQLIEDILNNKINTTKNTEEFIKLIRLIKDIEIILDNFKLIKSIKIDILENELKMVYKKDVNNFIVEITKKSFDVTPVRKTDKEFGKYESFRYTLFSSEGGGKLISEMEKIEKGKFI